MNLIEKLLRRLDAFQQRHVASAVFFGVQKKFGDDNGGLLIANMTYTAFVTIFPLLLLLVTVLGLVFSDSPSARHAILNSTLKNFPIIGNELGRNIHAIHRSSLIGLGVAIAALLYGTLGLAGSGLFAMEQVWNVPGTERPNFLKRTLRSLSFLGLLGTGVIVTTFLTGVGTFGSHQPLAIEVGAIALSVVLNCAQYLAAFRILTPKAVSSRSLFPGALLGGMGWTILQAFGSYLVGHTLKGESATYGMFAIVLGLLAWIYLGCRLSVYAAELNVVLHRRLWPRALIQPPLTEADRSSLAAQATQNRRRPEQHVEVFFDGDGAAASGTGVGTGSAEAGSRTG